MLVATNESLDCEATETAGTPISALLKEWRNEMVSVATAANVTLVLLEELGTEKALRLVNRLKEVEGNKSFSDSMGQVAKLLDWQPRDLLKICGRRRTQSRS